MVINTYGVLVKDHGSFFGLVKFFGNFFYEIAILACIEMIFYLYKVKMYIPPSLQLLFADCDQLFVIFWFQLIAYLVHILFVVTLKFEYFTNKLYYYVELYLCFVNYFLYSIFEVDLELFPYPNHPFCWIVVRNNLGPLYFIFPG